MVVIPGAWYVGAAQSLFAGGLTPGSRWLVTGASFERPAILTGEADITLHAEATRGADQRTEVRFYEGDAQSPVLARLTLSADEAPDPAAAVPPLDRWIANAGPAESAETYYRKLAEAGNRYGPSFQFLHLLWRLPGEALARLRGDVSADDPLLVDAAVQALASLARRPHRTFVLQGIAQLRRAATQGSAEGLWVRAVLEQQTADTGAGSVTVYDRDGNAVLEVLGVAYSQLDHAPAAPASAPGFPVVIAATFTAEPLEDSLRFWSQAAQLPLSVRFAPYNQVFQQLLDPASLARRNSNGGNALLINLADWLPTSSAAAPLPHPQGLRWPADIERSVLPNGAEVAHLNRHETEYVYQEIFGDRCYLRHGVELPETPVVVDIGANIGLFALFVKTERPAAQVFSFEPSPVAFRALAANCAAYGPGLQAVNAGVSQQRGRAELTFYAQSSVFSSFHPDAREDRGAIQTVVENMVRGELGPKAEGIDEYVQDLMTDRLDARRFDCALVSVSDILRDHGLPRIDLLKIDAEKCELEILRGIEPGDWNRIHQVVIEVHDRTGAAVEEVQSILRGAGFRCAVEEERLLAGSGLFNVYATRGELTRRAAASTDDRHAELQAKAESLERSLSTYAQAGGPPAVLCFCPVPTAGLSLPDRRQLEGLERRLRDFCRGLSSLTVVGSTELFVRHGPSGWHHRPADVVGHVPYLPEGYAWLAAAVVRGLAGARRTPFKVIALDCDQTLWRGACGEEGPLGVVVEPAHRWLQQFMIERMQAGQMLCLCSKNAEADVWAVFEQNPGMVLRREHLSAHRSNWRPKSENLRALAAELGVGEDAVLFIDDNPVEIAEVAAHVPAVVGITLPAAPESISAFFSNHWAFDTPTATAEDRARTRMMQEGAERRRFRAQTTSLADFIAGLELRIEVRPPSDAEVPRLAQLTQRTNQFNFTTVRRSEPDLRHFLAGGGQALAVTVRDRFGDYGLVGEVLFRCEGDLCRIDTFLLSCRVLGRGVEHAVLAALGRQVAAAGVSRVELPFQPTAKNQPAGDFLASLQGQIPGNAREFPAREIAQLRYHPENGSEQAPTHGEGASPLPAAPPSRAQYAEIAALLAEPGRLLPALEAFRFHDAETPVSAGLPDTPAGRLLGLWRRLLANPRIGMDDNFFDAGGTSLKAVQVVAAIRRELQYPVSVTVFFECPTVRLLAQKLAPSPAPATGADAPAGSDALERGARRKAQARLRRSVA